MCLHLTLYVVISLDQQNIRLLGYPVNSNHFGGAGTGISGIHDLDPCVARVVRASLNQYSAVENSTITR